MSMFARLIFRTIALVCISHITCAVFISGQWLHYKVKAFNTQKFNLDMSNTIVTKMHKLHETFYANLFSKLSGYSGSPVYIGQNVPRGAGCLKGALRLFLKLCRPIFWLCNCTFYITLRKNSMAAVLNMSEKGIRVNMSICL